MRDVTPDPYPPFDGVEPYGTVRSIADERAHRKRVCALGYRIFGALRWGMLGDGHISARDPLFTDHFWLLDWGVPFAEATVHQLVLVGPGGEVKNADGWLDGQQIAVRIAPDESPAANYGFDVTPRNLVTGLITERGICEANEKSIRSLFPEYAP